MIDIPIPEENESAVHFSDRLGRWYTEQATDEHKKANGQYLTPAPVAMFMALHCQSRSESVNILDPGAGTGILACAICENLADRVIPPKNISLTAYELDSKSAQLLKITLSYLKERLKLKNVSLEFEIKVEDFILANAHRLDRSPKLFLTCLESAEYDVVISNPPYFKLSKVDSRSKAASMVVHGQPNIYALFMAVSAHLLKSGGQLIFITPRSFASGPYFRRFREIFFQSITPNLIHSFNSRKDAFNRDKVLQENIIFSGFHNPLRQSAETFVEISSSKGIDDLKTSQTRTVPLEFILKLNTTDKILQIPISDDDDNTIKLINAWPATLKTYGLEISTGPVVAFRATKLLLNEAQNTLQYAPLLWLQHVKPLSVNWPLKIKKPEYIEVCEQSKALLLQNKNYVLLRRFSAKEELRRLTAGAYIAKDVKFQYIGLENHLNYIHRPKGELTEAETWGLAALLTSSLYDKYFRAANGNTQVSATELRTIPLPPQDLIIKLGQKIMLSEDKIGLVDELLRDELEELNHTTSNHHVQIHG